MKKSPQPTLDLNVLAVLHRSGREWHVLLVDRAGSKPAITAAKAFPSEQADRIDRWLVEQRAGSVYCVLPASAVICRTVPLPDAPAEQLAPALGLQAEAHLMGIAPPHRVGMAVLPASLGETTRNGLVLAWPESAEFIAPATTMPVRYVPDVAALAALLNGQRPDEPVMWLDRGDGSVAIAITHSGGAMFRATREEADSGENWQRSVGRIVAESALGVGHTGAFIENMVRESRAKASAVGPKEAALFIPKEVRDSAAARISGVNDDPKWWNEFGIAAGAAMVVTGSLAPLSQMLHTPPVRRPSRIRNALEAMSNPRTAATVIAVCILLLMFEPLVFAGLRLLVLKVRYGDVAQQLNIAKASRDQVAVYRELDRQKAWPMTKLLSDIATNAPLGIELDIIRVDNGKDFSVSGTAISSGGKTPDELVALMVANLRADNIFVDPAVSWGDRNNLGVLKFDITSKVARPFDQANYPPERDFAVWTHKDRRDGVPMPKAGAPGKSPSKPDDSNLAAANDVTSPREQIGASTPNEDPAGSGDGTANGDESANSMLAGASPEGDDSGDESGFDSGSRRPIGSNTGAGVDPTSTGGGVMSASQLPPPLSPEEIAAMSEAEVKKALTVVSRARPYATKDEDKERLKNEFSQLMEQLKKVKGGSS